MKIYRDNKGFYHINDIAVTELSVKNKYTEIAKIAGIHPDTVAKTFRQIRNNPDTIQKIRNACVVIFGKNLIYKNARSKKTLQKVMQNQLSVNSYL